MTRKKRKVIQTVAGAAAALAVCSTAQASLSGSYQFNGKGNWSLDGIGSNNDPAGLVQAFVPTGSYIEKAFLYSSLYSASSQPIVTLAGTTYSGAAWTPLGVDAGYLQAWRADVTDQMRTLIGGGSASTFNFQVAEGAGVNSEIDGEVLAIVYSNPSEMTRTIAFLDGFSASSGDTTSINYSAPLSKVGQPGFEALVSLGIGYGFQEGGEQFSIVNADGRLLTSSAGGFDDGAGYNGGLITVGGLGDSSANPVNPFSGPQGERYDDELYDLAQGNGANASPFIQNGDGSTVFTTQNPSQDDNIFFLGVNVTAEAGVNKPPPPPSESVPDANSTLSLLGLAAAGLAACRRMLGRFEA